METLFYIIKSPQILLMIGYVIKTLFYNSK